MPKFNRIHLVVMDQLVSVLRQMPITLSMQGYQMVLQILWEYFQNCRTECAKYG